MLLIYGVVYHIFSRVVKAFTSKTKNTLDDLVVDLIEEPIVGGIIATGIWFALRWLTLPSVALKIGILAYASAAVIPHPNLAHGSSNDVMS